MGCRWHSCLLQICKSTAPGWWINVDANHIFIGAWDEHILGSLDDCVSLFEGEDWILEVVVWVVEVDVYAPLDSSGLVLMLRIRGVTSYPDPIIRNTDSVVSCNFTLTPLKVEDIVGDIGPVLSHVFGGVEFLIDAAGLINELSASCPWGGEGPRALCRVENELLDALAGVQGLDVATTVFWDPINSCCTYFNQSRKIS